jgi:DNA-binding response OmpR family regulator
LRISEDFGSQEPQESDVGLATVVVYYTSAEEAQRIRSWLREAHYRALATPLPGEGAETKLPDETDRPEAFLVRVRSGDDMGFELCQRLKKSKHLRAVPVILIVSGTRRDEHEKALSAGADEILLEPVSRDELLARVGNVIRLARLRAELSGLRAQLRRKDEPLAQYGGGTT